MSQIIDTEKQKKIDEVYSKYEQKTRRGFLRLIILSLFYEQVDNMEFGGYHGWALIQKIEEINRNKWKPSPGSIYPILKEFSAPDNDLIEPTSNEGDDENSNEKITYRITDIGIEVFKRLEKLSPLVRPRPDFSNPVSKEKLKEGFKAHHNHRPILELKNMKERFDFMSEVLSEMITEKEKNGQEEGEKDNFKNNDSYSC